LHFHGNNGYANAPECYVIPTLLILQYITKMNTSLSASYRLDSRSTPSSVHVRYMSKKWHWERYFFGYFGFPLSLPFHYCSMLILIYTLPLPEGQTGESWEPSKIGRSLVNREALDRKVLSTVCWSIKCFLISMHHSLSAHQLIRSKTL